MSDGLASPAGPTPSARRAWRLRLFVDAGDEPRARRATDVIVLLVVLVGLGLLSLVATPQSSIEASLSRALGALPDVMDAVWRTLERALVGAALALAVATVVRWRLTLLRDEATAALVSGWSVLLLGRLVTGDWTATAPSADAAAWLPDIGVAAAAGAVAVMLPHLTRLARQGGRWLLAGGTLAPVLLGQLTPSQGAATLLAGIGGAAVVHLALGSTRGRPQLDDVRASLAGLGIEVDHLSAAERQPAGVYVLEARHVDGRLLDVKVYGGDASDTEFLSMLWRSVWYRDAATVPRTRVQQVEHEALLTLLAAQAGVAVPPVVTVGVTPNDDALLVLARPPEKALDAVLDEEALRATWQMLRRLHAAGIAHRQVDDRHLVMAGDQVGLTNFRGATVGAGEWARGLDRVQALVAGCLAVGVETSVDIAVEELGLDGASRLVPFVQPAACTPTQRRALREAELDLDDVRAAVAEATHVEVPELERLRRVTWASLVQVALPVLAFLALSAVVAGMDVGDLGDAIEGARGWFIAIAFVLAQLPRLTQALSTAGATPLPVPLPRLVVLQLAQSYLALTVPSSTARVAMNVRFFQRHGLTSGSALTVGALDSVFGFIGQMVALVLVLTLTSARLDLDLDSASSGLLRVVAVLAVVVLVTVAGVFSVPRWRDPIVAWVRSILHEGTEALRGLGSPRRLGLLLGGNLATELLFALTLGALAIALGHPVSLPELVLIHVAVGLLAGVMPVPGGIGVVEGGITYGLVTTGMPEETALAVAILFRAFTYYLPPLWGYVAFRWLTRNRFL